MANQAPNVVSNAVGTQDDVFIHDVLRPHQPYSLPLLRRCQFHLRQKHSTAAAEIRVFTCLSPSTTDQDDQRTTEGKAIFDPKSTPWLAAHIDLTVSGQTQVWLYASWEPDFSRHNNVSRAIQESPHYSVYEALFAALFTHIQHYHIINLENSPQAQWLRLKNEGKTVSEPYSRSKVLFGTVAECLWPFLDNYASGGHVTRDDRGYLKYIVATRGGSYEPEMAPKGLHFASMEEQHLQTIIDRSNIPRTLETLRQLPNIGLFDEDETPVAWGLLGKDGSMVSLHTEPDYRGRGLAESVIRRLMREQVKFFDDKSRHMDHVQGVTYSHADVSEKNLASRRVLEKVGGVVKWKVAWIELDLGEPA